MPFSLFLALRYLRPSRSFISVVTVISVVGVLLGVAILVIVLSVMTGFDDMWREKILSFKPHLTIQAWEGPLEDADDLCARVRALPGIAGAAPTVETRVLLQHAGRMTAPVIIGITAEGAAQVSQVPSNIIRGAFSLDEGQILIGSDLARQVGAQVGDRLLVYSPLNVVSKDDLYLPEELEVAGIYNMGMYDFDAGIVLAPLAVARDLVGLREGAQSVYVMTDDPLRVELATEAVRDALGPGYLIRSWREIDSVLFDALRHEKTMMFLLLVFITIVAIFCVTNTLIVITVQKTHEIGLLKALGFSNARIMGAFVWHGLVQCIVGIVAGLGAGLAVLHNLPGIVRLLQRVDVSVFPKEIYRLDEIPWATSSGELARVAAFVLVFCVLASLLPAWRAARLDPVEALRQE